MLDKTGLTLFFIFICWNFAENFALKRRGPSSNCELFSSKPVPYPTLSPIKLDTGKAKTVHLSSPLTNRNSLFPLAKIINTGRALTLRGNPPYTSTRVYGGVLCNETYIFHIAEFYQTQNLTGRGFGEMNGKTTQLVVTQTYFKKAYGTFENALNYRDGLVIETLPISFSSVDNFFFNPIQRVIKLLRKAGSFRYVPSIFTFAWYGMKLPYLRNYFSFYGSYIDLETGKQYQSAIILVPDRPVQGLSKRQFEESFLQLLDKNGQKLDNAPPLQDFGQRKVYQGNGFVNLWF